MSVFRKLFAAKITYFTFNLNFKLKNGEIQVNCRLYLIKLDLLHSTLWVPQHPIAMALVASLPSKWSRLIGSLSSEFAKTFGDFHYEKVASATWPSDGCTR